MLTVKQIRNRLLVYDKLLEEYGWKLVSDGNGKEETDKVSWVAKKKKTKIYVYDFYSSKDGAFDGFKLIDKGYLIKLLEIHKTNTWLT